MMDSVDTAAQETYCGVPVDPDKEEKKLIRRRYLKVGAVIVFNCVMFNYILIGLIYLAGNFLGKGDTVSIRTKDWLSGSEALHTLISCMVPIISEALSIIIGTKLLKINFRSLFTFDGFTGGELAKATVISLGLQTVASILAVVISYILKAIGFESATADLSAVSSPAATIFLYFYACLLGPVLEELLYRGVILQGMRKYNERFAILVSALIFGLMHQNYQQFMLGFLLGIVFGAVALKTGSLVPTVIMHIIVNTSGVLAQLVLEIADYETFTSILSGDIDISSMKPAFIAALAVNAVFRYGMLIAGIILLIFVLIKRDSIKKPTPAGKTRGWPILAQTWIWYVIFAGYIYLAFVEPIKYVGK